MPDERAPELPAEQVEAGPQRRAPFLPLLQLGAVLVVGALLALLVWHLTQASRGRDLIAAIQADKKPPAPEFRLPVIWPHAETWPARSRRVFVGGRLPLGALRGQPVVLNFWASWCVPCKKEAPLLVASAKRHAGKVAFLGVDVQDFTSDARHFLARYRVNYVSVRDGAGSTYDGYEGADRPRRRTRAPGLTLGAGQLELAARSAAYCLER
jgi:cytochrome c biogenesis protein CcmG/thiol:disulfide interchange protein DsbE